MEEQQKPVYTHGSKPFESFKGKETSLEEYFANYPSARRQPATPVTGTKTLVVIGQHRYYNRFSAQLAEASLSTAGTLKNPLTILNPIDFVWGTQEPDELKFYAAITKFQTFYEKSQADLEGMKALVKNPLRYDFYLHDSRISEKINSKSVHPVQVSRPDISFRITVGLRQGVYTLTGELSIGHTSFPLNQITTRLDHFLIWGDYWYLCENINLLHAISYFIKHNNCIQLPQETFPAFQEEVLTAMESYVTVEHTYLQPVNSTKLEGFDNPSEKFIYLSDQIDYVRINPVMKYGEMEIPVLTKRQVYGKDHAGRMFRVERHGKAEDEFIALLVRQHPDFKEQLDNPLLYFYLHKTRFLDENWFLKVFEEWAGQGITVFGFSELEGNKLNPNKASISINVSSGLNWFNTKVEARFGRKKAAMKEIQKSIKSKSRFVRLDDGTMGILPEEWLSKLESYFSAGEVEEETVKIPKINYSRLSELFETHMLDQEVQEELNLYETRLTNFEAIQPAPVPAELKGTLRPYQVQGLSWLNFLDDFNFGGCLADDMGLGKSVQIIAFILILRKKSGKNTHLLVVPTSLIQNWEEEIQKFAPSIEVHVHHGSGRLKNTAAFETHEVIITTYNTLVSDVAFLRRHLFAYVFLDESQNIKNATSQRYKAARLLNSRNKVVLSGTPLENNTFDLYAQLSFACPGLLGTKSFFRNMYSVPIDKFKSKRSAQALQQKISPFILRRTKKEVARELPEKTEVTLYCEMEPEQRKIYDVYEREFREYISATDEEEIAKNPMHVLKGITKLRQICNSPRLADKLSEGPSSKIATLMEQVKNITGEHKVLVFSQFVSMLDLIQKELVREKIPHVCLTGKTQNRGDLVNRFQKDDSIRIFLISLKAGGTGLNLTAADYVFLVDPWWNPAVENQAIDRCYRIGQQKNVIAARLICPDTIEEKILIMQQNKSKLATGLVHTNDNFFKSLTRKDLLKLSTTS